MNRGVAQYACIFCNRPLVATTYRPVAIRQRIHVAAGILLDSSGQVLIGQRPAQSTHSPEYWEFPGGKLEVGETAYEALKRELAEEIGVTVADAVLLSMHSHEYRERHVVLYFFLSRHWHGDVQPLDGQQLAWCAPSTLSRYRMLPGDEPVVATLPDLLRDVSPG